LIIGTSADVSMMQVYLVLTVRTAVTPPEPEVMQVAMKASLHRKRRSQRGILPARDARCMLSQ